MRTIIRYFLFQRFSKAIIDFLLLFGLVLAMVSARSAVHSWYSFHCIIGMTWYVLMLVHIGQHWQMTKALLTLNRKVLKRNIMTFVTLIVFILLTCTIILFIVGVNDRFVHIHHAVASPLRLVIIIHAITKVRRFLACFRWF